ncbi:MAG: glutamate-5-semialdehyde dehydrogenase, partial [Planctomycetia bacterium]
MTALGRSATTLPTDDLGAYCERVAARAKDAARELATSDGARRNRALRRLAELLRGDVDAVLEANALDLAAAPGYGLSTAAVDRLRLTKERLAKMADAVDEVAGLADPVGLVLEGSV